MKRQKHWRMVSGARQGAGPEGQVNVIGGQLPGPSQRLRFPRQTLDYRTRSTFVAGLCLAAACHLTREFFPVAPEMAEPCLQEERRTVPCVRNPLVRKSITPLALSATPERKNCIGAARAPQSKLLYCWEKIGAGDANRTRELARYTCFAHSVDESICIGLL
jgi:hypothetical protein